MRTQTREFLVSANGVSLNCTSDTLLGWVEFLIDMGRVPKITEITKEESL